MSFLVKGVYTEAKFNSNGNRVVSAWQPSCPNLRASVPWDSNQDEDDNHARALQAYLDKARTHDDPWVASTALQPGTWQGAWMTGLRWCWIPVDVAQHVAAVFNHVRYRDREEAS